MSSSERTRNGERERKAMELTKRETSKRSSTKLRTVGIIVFGISSMLQLYFYVRNWLVVTQGTRHGVRKINDGQYSNAMRRALVEDVRSFLSRQKSTEEKFNCLTPLGGKLDIALEAVDQVLPFFQLDHQFNGTELEQSFFRLKERFRLAAVLRRGSFELAWDAHPWDHVEGIFSWARLSAMGLKDILADAIRRLERSERIQYPIVLVFNAKSGAGQETVTRASISEAPVFSYCKAPGNEKHLLFPRYYMNEQKIWEDIGSRITAYRPTGNQLTPRDNRLDYMNGSWAEKLSKAVFYGSLLSQSRKSLFELSLKHPQTLDVRLTDLPCRTFPHDNYPCVNKTDLKPAEWLSLQDQVAKYKFVVSASGVDEQCADRLPFLLTGNSVVLKQESAFQEWWYSMLSAGEHFVSIASDWRNLTQAIRTLEQDEEKAEKMYRKARKLMRESFPWAASLCYSRALTYLYRRIVRVGEGELEWFKNLENHMLCDVGSTLHCKEDRRNKHKHAHSVTVQDRKTRNEVAAVASYWKSWSFKQQIYLDNVKSCLQSLDTNFSEVSNSLHPSRFQIVRNSTTYKALRELLASGVRGNLLYVGPYKFFDKHRVHSLVTHSSSSQQCKSVWVRRELFLRRNATVFRRTRKQKLGRLAFVLVNCFCEPNFLSTLKNRMKEGGVLILLRNAKSCVEDAFHLFSASRSNPSVFVKHVTHPNFPTLWDILMTSSIQAMEFSSWGKNFRGMGHVGEVRLELQAIMNLIRARNHASHICEIGFNAGHSAVAILGARANISLTSFDLGVLPWSTGLQARVAELFPNRFFYIRGNSAETVPMYKRKVRAGVLPVCDIFLVDGGHTYDKARADFQNAVDVLAEGGYLFADDHSPTFPGVMRAWDNLVTHGSIQYFRCERPRETYEGFQKGWCIGQHFKRTAHANNSKYQKTVIHIATTQCGSNPEDLLELEVLLKSIIMASSPDLFVHVHLTVDDRLSKPFLGRIQGIIQSSGMALHIHYAMLLKRNITLFKECSMERLLLPELLPEVACVVYVDRDSIVLQDLKHFYESACDLGNRLLGAVPNASPWYPIWEHGMENMGVTYVPKTGIQAGILSLNLKLMRKLGFQKEILRIATVAPFTTLGDQDLLNFYFANRTAELKLLDCRYNLRVFKGEVECDCDSLPMQSQAQCRQYSAIDDAIVLHGNRGAFRKESGIQALIWRKILSIDVRQLQGYPVSLDAYGTFLDIVNRYETMVLEPLLLL